MALTSPGVQVTVTDESQYLPASTNSVPFILLATAQNKPTPSGVGIAAGTIKANAGKTYLITSQQDLASTFGTPYFYQTSAGTPINGYELNEYGLLTAYTCLGVSNQCYVQRADVDLAALTASLTRPQGAPTDGTTWLDTSTTQWGIFQWNIVTGQFTNQVPLVITDTAQTLGGVPLASFGSIGQYAVNTTSIFNPTFFKRGGATPAQTTSVVLQGLYNTWVLVGSNDWESSWATVQGTSTPTSITIGAQFTINGQTITVPADNTPTGVMNEINALSNGGTLPGVYAAVIGGALVIFTDSDANGNGTVVLTDGLSTPLQTLGITPATYYTPAYQASPSFTVPRWASFDTQPEPTGSVWQKINNVNLGTNIVVKRYSSVLGAFVQQTTPVYTNDAAANFALDPSGGGALITPDTTYAQVSPGMMGIEGATSSFQVFSRYATGPAQFPGTNTSPVFGPGDQFIISATTVGSAVYNSATATIGGTGSVADFLAAVSDANVPYVSASVSSSGAVVLEHSAGGDIIVIDQTGNPLTDAGFNTSILGARNTFNSAGVFTGLTLSYWVTTPTFTYTATGNAPDTDPDNGTTWYYSDATVADIMVQDGGQWRGYQTVAQDIRGYNLTLTNATGPIFSANPPTTQTNTSLSPLVYGDLWIDTGDLENYPLISRWQNVNGQDQWVQISNADQTTTNGILFADARWGTNGGVNPITDPLPTITSLLVSNYLDIDAPQSTLYAEGTLLFNTRRSGFNVKSFEVNYFNNTAFPADDWVSSTNYVTSNYVIYNNLVYVALANTVNQIPSASPAAWSQLSVTNAWVTTSGNRADGSPYTGRNAQRAIIVQALKAAVDSNVDIREEYNQFNLQSCPSYPELAPNLRLLNNDRGETGFTVVDTPLRLTPNEVVNWATNNRGLGLPSGDGLLVNGDTYAGAFYPSCLTNDTNGNQVVCPPSYMMVRTIIRSDQQSFPWFAPAGTQRGVVDNAQQLGYIDATTGEFITIGVRQGLRDVLYQNNVNPITFLPGVGITNFGNKTLQGTFTALDRINVARLVAFLRGRLQEIGKQYLFQPNDQITRQSIANNVTSLMIDLIAKRGIYDYLVVCDSSNNTPARIDRNELWVDVAIEPVKAVEFIYIPLRILNTGAIAGGTGASAIGTGGTGPGA